MPVTMSLSIFVAYYPPGQSRQWVEENDLTTLMDSSLGEQGTQMMLVTAMATAMATVVVVNLIVTKHPCGGTPTPAREVEISQGPRRR